MINFAQTLRFKRRKFEVIVNIPESELDLTATPSAFSSSGAINDNSLDSANLILTKIEQILGPYYLQRPKASIEQDKAIYVEALEEKYSR